MMRRSQIRRGAVRSYRCYLLTSDLHIRNSAEVECASDEEARLEGERLLANSVYQWLEIWDGRRLVTSQERT